jgi:DNA modification methylase
MNKLILGDCLEIMKTLKNKSVDMVLTSPPYDNLRDYKGYTFNFEGIAKELYRITKDGGVVVWIVGDATIKGSETGTSFRQALYFKEIGFNLHDTMIYRKNSLTFPDTTRYYQCFEYMFVFTKGKIKTVNLIQDKENKQANKTITGNYRDIDGSLKEMSGSKNKRAIKEKGVRWNIWDYNTGWQHSYTEDFLRGHPAIYPEKLAEDHILSWSNEGDTVLDPMAGSGTTLKMAKKNNRKYIGIEIAPEYIEIAKARIEATEIENKLL